MGRGLAVLLVATCAIAVTDSTAVGATPSFEAPFRCGETYSASTYQGHGAAIDLARRSGSGANLTSGTPVVASASGTVIEAGYQSVNGNYVRVQHGSSGWVTYYGHLSSISVERRQKVSAGQTLGRGGNTGSTGGFHHVHYQQESPRGTARKITFRGKAPAVWFGLNEASKGRNTSRNTCPIKPKITASPPHATIRLDDAYSARVKASGRPTPTFRVSSGTLPPGVVLNRNGVLSGAPTGLGSFTFRIAAANSAGSASTQAITLQVLEPDADGDGVPGALIGHVDNTRSTPEALPDLVGFASAGPVLARNLGDRFASSTASSTDFGTRRGWSGARHPRVVTDVNADGRPDIVGFGNAGVSVALGADTGFASSTLWTKAYGYASGGWRVEHHPRVITDVTGDGLPDVVGFAHAGVAVARNTGTSFAEPTTWSTDFGTKNGWRTSRHPRAVLDVDGDGRPDVVGFGNSGVSVALNLGSGFGPSRLWTSQFGYKSGGWRTSAHPRTLIDVNNDGLPDIVGFAKAGVSVALNTGSGFATATTWSNDLVVNTGWKVVDHPRVVVDVDGDDRPDLVGFGDAGVSVALNRGSNFARPTLWTSSFGYRGEGWRVELHPRSVVDVTGDGRPDILGFSSRGVSVSRNTGTGFAAPTTWSAGFGTKGGWTVADHPRIVR